MFIGFVMDDEERNSVLLELTDQGLFRIAELIIGDDKDSAVDLLRSPAVSTRTTGPIPKISMDFFTGSVVVPAWAETMAMDCPVSLLIMVLLPLFVLP